MLTNSKWRMRARKFTRSTCSKLVAHPKQQRCAEMDTVPSNQKILLQTWISHDGERDTENWSLIFHRFDVFKNTLRIPSNEQKFGLKIGIWITCQWHFSSTLDEKDEGKILVDKKFVDLPVDSIKETLTTSLKLWPVASVLWFLHTFVIDHDELRWCQQWTTDRQTDRQNQVGRVLVCKQTGDQNLSLFF